MKRLVSVSTTLIAVCSTACGADSDSRVATSPATGTAPMTATSVVKGPAPSATRVGAPTPLGTQTDEGMWLLNDFPADRVASRYGFTPTKEWLDHVRLSSVRLALGCSGSFVSPTGLVMTNHHCAEQCIEQLSTKQNDLHAKGFNAAQLKDERKCPGMEVNQLVEIADVTSRVREATAGKEGASYNDALKAVTATLEKECAKDDATRCDVVSLYRGGLYHLYRYRRFQDVRLVFAPEAAIANFGGDPDNFNFPRYNLDASFLRVYDKDAPLKADHYLKWSPSGVKDGDLTFVSGHPGGTSRLLTMAQLAFKRDVELPTRLMWLSETRGILLQFASRGAEEARVSSETLHHVENSLKALRGRREALVDAAFMQKKRDEEESLRNYVEGNASFADARAAWPAIEKAQEDARRLYIRWAILETVLLRTSDLFAHARTLVRAADELAKKNEERLPELTDAKMPGVKARLLADAPIYASLERVMLEHALLKMRELLGPDDPVVRKVLGKKSPAELAAAAVGGTKLRDKNARKALLEGGKAAITSSNDPMIVLARAVDDDARAVRKAWEDRVDAPTKKNAERIAAVRFATYGTKQYPDATFSLRLSFGAVKGFPEGDHEVKPFTDFAGVFDRATGSAPFALPQSWVAAKSKLALATPFNFATTNDIIGGNSGSPVVDKKGEVVGLIFDGNIHSLAGDFGYDGVKGRAVAVHAAGITEALDKVYGAKRLLGELVSAK